MGIDRAAGVIEGCRYAMLEGKETRGHTEACRDRFGMEFMKLACYFNSVLVIAFMKHPIACTAESN